MVQCIQYPLAFFFEISGAKKRHSVGIRSRSVGEYHTYIFFLFFASSFYHTGTVHINVIVFKGHKKNLVIPRKTNKVSYRKESCLPWYVQTLKTLVFFSCSTAWCMLRGFCIEKMECCIHFSLLSFRLDLVQLFNACLGTSSMIDSSLNCQYFSFYFI